MALPVIETCPADMGAGYIVACPDGTWSFAGTVDEAIARSQWWMETHAAPNTNNEHGAFYGH